MNNEYMKEYMRKYRQKPEVRERERKWHKEYIQRPEVKKRLKEYLRKYWREYLQRPGIRKRIAEQVKRYEQRPEVKERRRKYRNEYLKVPGNRLKHEIRWITTQFHRKKLLNERPFCEICETKDNLIIHHKVYKYPIDENDLLILCRRCHYFLHKNINDPLNILATNLNEFKISNMLNQA